MALFILIDHSIESLGGHHYEYARCVLEAARQAGYRPILAVNKRFAQDPALPFEIRPLYNLGFWPRASRAKSVKIAISVLDRLRRSFYLLRYRALFSGIGTMWLMRGSPLQFWKSRSVDSNLAESLLWGAGAGLLGVELLFRWLMLLIPFRARIAASFTAAFRSAGTETNRITGVLAPGGPLASERFQRAKRADFARSTTRLLEALPISDDDIVFVPTLGEPEMLGLLETFRRVAAATRPSYHLLFRRDLGEGRELAAKSARQAFFQFRVGLSGQRVHFYTDTEELSRQYDRLGIFKFGVCPIPHTATPADGTRPGDPIRITYLGDARAEKGYHRLPALVQDLWRNYALTGKVKFVFQSNYNVDPGEAAAVVARGQLECFPPEQVRLIRKACTSAEYRELLLGAGLIVLPYDSALYSARSSGVLIEALSAGIPVVVPPHCWLSTQIAVPTERYRAALASTDLAQPATGLRWMLEDGPIEFPALNAPFRIGGEDRGLAAWFDVPADASHMLVCVCADWGSRSFIGLRCGRFDESGRRISTARETLGSGDPEGRASGLIEVPPSTRRMRLSITNAIDGTAIAVHEVSVYWLTGSRRAIPRSAAGVTYPIESTAAITAAVREILDHYDHYRRTAIEFAAYVGERHNSHRLIELLRAA
jgi:hypothetical protein